MKYAEAQILASERSGYFYTLSMDLLKNHREITYRKYDLENADLNLEEREILKNKINDLQEKEDSLILTIKVDGLA